jgi:hypothetical protein
MFLCVFFLRFNGFRYYSARETFSTICPHSFTLADMVSCTVHHNLYVEESTLIRYPKRRIILKGTPNVFH